MKENSLIIPVFLHLLFEIAIKNELQKEIYNTHKNTYFVKVDNIE